MKVTGIILWLIGIIGFAFSIEDMNIIHYISIVSLYSAGLIKGVELALK